MSTETNWLDTRASGMTRTWSRVSLIAMLAILAVVALVPTATAQSGNDLELASVSFTSLDTDGDGLNDSVEVQVKVQSNNDAGSEVMVLKAALMHGTEEVSAETFGKRLDPLANVTTSLRVTTRTDSPKGSFDIVVTLYADMLGGEEMDADQRSFDLYPVGDYKLEVTANRTSAEVLENTTTEVRLTLESLSNNPTGVAFHVTPSRAWTYELVPDNATIDPFSSLTFIIRVTAPPNEPAGSRMTMEVEAYSVRNHTAFSTVSLTFSIALQVFDVTLDLTSDHLSMATGETRLVYGFVTNTGNNLDNVTLLASIPSGWIVTFVPEHLELARGTRGTFEMAISSPGTLTGAGVVIINVTARSSGLVAEATRSLRMLYNTAELSVKGSNVTLSPSEPQAGDTVTLQAQVGNSGAATASSVRVTLTSDGVQVATTVILSIPPDGVGIATLSWEPSPGGHLLRVVVDPDREMSETDRTNNEVSLPIDVTSADLVIAPTNITLDPSYPTEGSVATVMVTVRNRRTVVTVPFDVNLYIDDVLIHTFEGDVGLLGGGNVTLEHRWNATSGRHAFRAIADPDGKVIEEDRSNNVATRSFSVNSMPVAVLSANKDRMDLDEVATFDASDSSDPDGRVRQYFFDYGDGSDSGWVFDPVITHRYSSEGDYEVRLYVRDESGAQNDVPPMVEMVVEGRDTGDDGSPGMAAFAALAALVTGAVAGMTARRRRCC